MVRTKKILSVILAIMMLMQTFVITNFAADIEGFTDFPTNSWSTEAMTAAVENGLLVGTSETTIEPQKNLTRAEFAAIVTRAFGATKTADISKFKDVDENDWFYGSVAKVVQMGVMNGTGETTFAPNAFMKREDVILALARVLFVNGDDTSVLDQFSDKAKIDNWSVKAIAGMVAEDYVHGYEDGTIRPLNYITREELAQLFHNIFKTYISEDGEYNSVAKKGSVIVRSKYVTLKDVTIDGDLIMADGIGDGDFRISNVHVTGKIIARGGEGMNYFVNVTADGKVIVNDPNGVVNFYNYREEDTPFKGGNVIENTPATFLERETPTAPSIGGGGGADYDFYIYDSYESITNNLDPEVKLENKGASYKIKDSDVPTVIDGKKVAGWYKKDNIEFYDRSDLVGKKIKDVEGKWYPVYLYTINFVTDSGTTAVEKIENKAIETAEIPEVTVDESKEFKGWTKTEGSTNVDFTNDALTADVVETVFGSTTEVTLYPVIVDKDSYSVIFKPANDGETDREIKKYDPDYVLADSDVPADPSKADHTFKGWSKDPAATEGEERDYFIGKKISEVEGTWYPVFEENPDVYTITFVTDAGNVPVTKTEGERIAANEIPVITVDESKEFKGWTKTEGSTNVDFTNDALTADVVETVFGSTTEVTLYPVIVDKDSYSVIFKPANDGETDKEVKKYDPDYVLTDSDVPADPTKADHTFKGWAKDPAATEGEERDYFIGKKISEVEGTWYPVFEENPDVYTITFVTDAGNVPVTKTEGEAIADSEIPVITVDESKEFKGWTKTEGSTNVDFTNNALTADVVETVFGSATEVTLYPVIVDKDTYVVIFVNGTGTSDKTITKYDPNYVLTNADLPVTPISETSRFTGWKKDVNDPDDGYMTSDFEGKKISEVVGTWYPTSVSIYSITFKDNDDNRLENFKKEIGETISELEIPEVTAPEGYEFEGWATVKNSNTVEFTNEELTADAVENLFDSYRVWLYPVFKEISITLVFEAYNPLGDGSTTPIKTMTLTWNSVIERGNLPGASSGPDREFLGWGTDKTATTAEYTNDILSSDKIGRVLGVSGSTTVTLYTIYRIIPVQPDEYIITFVTDAGNVVVEKTEGERINASEIPVVSVEATQKFNGWTTTAGSTNVNFTNDALTADVVENVFDSTEVTLYPVIVDKDAVDYYVEHYFEQLDGTYVLDSKETFSAKPGEVVTATALTTLPDGYKGENVDHADRVEEGTVIAEGEAGYPLTLKLYYALEVLKVNYYDFAIDEDNPVLVYDVKYGGTIDNFCYEDAAFDAADNEAIKAEIKEYVEYLNIPGYGKNYDDKYLYNKFEDELGGYYYYTFGAYRNEHEINFKWYVEDAAEEYVVFDETHVFYEDLDLFSKVKKLNVVIGFPEELVGENVLTINVPYEESTRFLDSVRDALYINKDIATYPKTTGMEEKMYDKLSTVGGKFFDGDGIFNDRQEINNTDVMIYFYQMMGGKSGYRQWLWEEVEDAVEAALGDRGPRTWRSYYESLRTSGLNQEQALYEFFVNNDKNEGKENKPAGAPPVAAQDKYWDSAEFIEMSTEEEFFYATVKNDFIMERVEEKISSLATIDQFIDEYVGDKIPAGLLNRLPMDMVRDIYEPRVAGFLADLEEARNAAKLPGYVKEDYPVGSGIIFDINLVEELLIPMMDYAKEMHEAAVEKAVSSDNKAAELVEKYYVDNPYTTGKAGNYGVVNYAFNPDFYVTKTRVDENGEGRYKINSFYDIYTEMVMPETVETIDALLWYMDPEGGAVDFARIRSLAEENEDLILALHNHPHNLMKQYAENGLPEDMAQYWEDLLSDPDIKEAVEKLDNKVSFDMMFFVEDKINNATLEMYFMKALNRVGVPAETFLGKYTNSKAYKELTHEDFAKLLDQLEECWATETVEVDGEEIDVVNIYGTTDYVFDNVLEKVGGSGNKATAALKGFEMTITRFFADTVDQVAPEDID